MKKQIHLDIVAHLNAISDAGAPFFVFGRGFSLFMRPYLARQVISLYLCVLVLSYLPLIRLYSSTSATF